MVRFPLLLAALFAAACSGATSDAPDAGAAPGKADGGGGTPGAFDILTLDSDAPGALPLSLAVKGGTVGVAYWAEVHLPDGGPARELRYVEKGKAPEKVATTTRVYGGSLAYDGNGAPHIAYLGPPSNGGTYWLEASLALATRSGGSWSSAAVVTRNEVLGLWPAIAFSDQGVGAIAFRNVHFSQFQVQGGEHSDVGFVSGGPGAWTESTAVSGQNRQAGHGGMLSMAWAEPAGGGAQQPAMAWSGQTTSADDTPKDVWFIHRKADGTWPADPIKIRSVGDTGHGPSLAWSKGAGFFVAWRDVGQGQLNIAESSDGVDWHRIDQVHGSGTGGWFPSAAFTADGFPAVAYYVCSDRVGVTPPCPADEDELKLAWRVDDVWQRVTVDPAGGRWIKLAWWQGRAVVAYRDVAEKTLKLAIQR